MSKAFTAQIELFRNLEEVQKQHQNSDASGRIWAREILGILIDYVQSMSLVGATSLIRPLLVLHIALYELDRGITEQILKPSDVTAGRTPDTVRRIALRGTSAAVMSVLMKLGLGKHEAASRVAKLLSAKNVKATSRSGITADTISQWRDQMHSKTVEAPGRIFYDMVVQKEGTAIPGRGGHQMGNQFQKKAIESLLRRFSSNIEELQIIDP